MSTLLLDPDTVAGSAAGPAPRDLARQHQLPGGTLDALISRTWNVLLADASAACPLCAGEMAPRYAAGAAAVGGVCRSCGTQLS